MKPISYVRLLRAPLVSDRHFSDSLEWRHRVLGQVVVSDCVVN